MTPYQLMIDRFKKQFVKPQDQALLNILFKKNAVQSDIDNYITKIDIEKIEHPKALLLYYFLNEHPNLHLNDYTEPRVRGLNRYFHFQNIKILAHFSRIGKALNQAGIPFILFKGGAMKAYRPDLSRPMGDTDILLPPGTIREAVKISEKLGYKHTRGKPTHAVGMHTDEEDAVDLHYKVFDEGKDMDALQKNFFDRAKPFHAFGVDFLMPSHEDLFFLIINNFTKNLREKTTLGGIYYALVDVAWLLRTAPDFDFSVVRENAILGDKGLETRFGADLMNNVVPHLIPGANAAFPFDSSVHSFCNLLLFDEKVYRPLRQTCQAMRVAELRNFPIPNGKHIVKFLIFDKMRKYPWFVRWYINNRMSKGAFNAH